MQENFSVLPTTTRKPRHLTFQPIFFGFRHFIVNLIFYKGKSNHVKSMLTRNILGSSACAGTTNERRKPNNKSYLELHCWSFYVLSFCCCYCFMYSAPGTCKGNCKRTRTKKLGQADYQTKLDKASLLLLNQNSTTIAYQD